jgi:S1-C subfamily serine protease
VNFVDLIIIGVALAAAIRGATTGFLRQIGSLGGFVLGLIIGATLAPAIANWLQLGSSRSLAVVTIFFAIALTCSGLGEMLGARIASLAGRTKLAPLDETLGAAFGLGGTLLAIWLLTSSFGTAVGPVLATDIQQSSILGLLDRTLPPAPDVMARLEQIVGTSRFPRVFTGLEPTPAAPVSGPDAAAVAQAVAHARASTVKVISPGCGGISEGSGFVVGPGLVATNAHVVAGGDQTFVIDTAGQHAARVVMFDPNLDLSVLRVSGLAGPVLPLDAHVQSRGTLAAALGYPGGGSFTAGAAAILQNQTAIGRNIYDSGVTSRDIYVLQAVVRPGNSGGPLVTPSGTVIGVIFATSTVNPNVGYALTSDEIIPDINRAAAASATVSTGQCLAE